MAQMWDSAREAFANGDIDWLTDTIDIRILDGYTFAAADTVVGDLTGVVATAALAGKTNVGGILDGGDVTYTAVAPSSTITSVVVSHNATGRLIVHYDLTASGQPIDVDTTGADVIVRWSNSTYKMFRI